MRKTSIGLTAAAAMILSATATAATYNGAGGAIPDPPAGVNPWGAPGQLLESTITVTDSFIIGTNPTDVSIQLNQLAQTWQGDLWARVTGPNGVTVNLFQRAGQSSTSTFGFSNDFVAANSYTWNDSGATSTAFSTPTVIPSGVYRGFTNTGANLTTTNSVGPGPATNIFESFIAAFGGINAQGNWTLRITDFGSGDAGTLGGWTLTLVPTPGAFALLGLAGLVGTRRRRN